MIKEFIDDVTPGSLKPSDPLTLVKNRAWIEYGGVCLADLYMIEDHKDEDNKQQQMKDCIDQLQRVGDILSHSSYFK